MTEVVTANPSFFHKYMLDVYVIDFFQSPIYSDQFFVSIDKFYQGLAPKMHYYINIEGIKFLVPKDFPPNLFKILKKKKNLKWQEIRCTREFFYLFFYYSNEICIILKESWTI